MAGTEESGRVEAGAARIAVLLPYPFAGPLDYAAPAGAPPPGTIVAVPLRRRSVLGVVWDAETGSPREGADAGSLRSLGAAIDAPPLPSDLRRFIEWVAAYTLSPPGEVLAMALRIDPRQPPRAPRRAMEFASPDPAHAPPRLTVDQAGAAVALRAAVDAKNFSVTLLAGVTGSGKTEVYFEAIAACLAAGRQALVLLPEIALSAQILARFAARFGVAPAAWHSELGPALRRRTWRAVAEGRARVVVGARSALFLPFTELGLVIVDEEHEGAFKQEEGVIYHARDMAVVRGRLANAPVVLVSATPSLETLSNVAAGRYRRLDLPARHGGAALPAVEMIDLRAAPPPRGRFLAPRLVAAIAETLARGEQAMLFLNRRGYAPLTLCRACGHRLECPHCTAWLVAHRARPDFNFPYGLICHHCGHEAVLPRACPACGAEGSLVAVGPGVERITEEAAALFPDARQLVMASDTLVGAGAAMAAAEAILERRVDLIIGTQIVAKGWHFPHLTLVGVVDADLGLNGGDLRCAERTFQLLHQVAGRAGRAGAPGRVLLQSFSPEHPVMRALRAGDPAGFLAAETTARRAGHWPPYGRLAALIVSAASAPMAEDVARRLARAAPAGPGITVLGPAPAPLTRLRGRYRQRLLLKVRREVAIQPLLRAWLAAVAPPGGVRVVVDVDPFSFL